MPNSLKKLLPARFRSDETVVPVVRLNGVIMTAQSPLRATVSLASVAPLLKKAFESKKAPAVALSINSPGGSPVQSRLIYQRVRDLADEHKKDVFVFVEDVAASGGYMIACAGDEIVADPSSIVGSIGVVAATFGFVELIEKIGVERRVYTSGKNKVTLDPFRPEKTEDVEHLKSLQREVHETFIDLVKNARGVKLGDDPDLFTGLFWTGKRGVELGLVDRLGDLRGVLREHYGKKVKPQLIQQGRGFPGRRLLGIGAREGLWPDPALVGAGAGEHVLGALEERALWARYGL